MWAARQEHPCAQVTRNGGKPSSSSTSKAAQGSRPQEGPGEDRNGCKPQSPPQEGVWIEQMRGEQVKGNLETEAGARHGIPKKVEMGAVPFDPAGCAHTPPCTVHHCAQCSRVASGHRCTWPYACTYSTLRIEGLDLCNGDPSVMGRFCDRQYLGCFYLFCSCSCLHFSCAEHPHFQRRHPPTGSCAADMVLAQSADNFNLGANQRCQGTMAITTAMCMTNFTASSCELRQAGREVDRAR
jgi:hypothetical protein